MKGGSASSVYVSGAAHPTRRIPTSTSSSAADAGLPRGRPRGQRIEVRYRYDEDGRVQATARDLATGRAAEATIVRQGSLASSEIGKLRQEVARATQR